MSGAGVSSGRCGGEWTSFPNEAALVPRKLSSQSLFGEMAGHLFAEPVSVVPIHITRLQSFEIGS
eukprot:scaffold297_cov171-Amphora_coffeaeformis.AAC.6